MDRPIVYSQEQGRSTDFMFGQRAAMIGLSKLAEATLGTSTLVYGLSVGPSSPAALTVVVQPGQIFAEELVDATAYGILPADTAHSILKQGLLMDALTLSCPAPTTSGYSINYLIEAAYQDQDTNNVVLPYFNSANPSQPLSGQNNTGATQATERQGVCLVQVKAGGAALTGTQATPSLDSGYVGLAVVTVAYGQTTITSSNIAVYSGAPLISNLLTMMQNGSANYASDTGAANAYAITLTPAPTALVDGMTVKFKAGNTNTGPSTLNVNGLGPVALVASGGAVLNAGQIVAGGYYEVIYSSSAAEWLLLAQSAGAVAVANANASNEAVALGQLQNDSLSVSFTSGAFSQPVTIPNAATSNEAVALGQANSLYAPIGFSQVGSITAATTLTAAQSGNTFEVAAATAAYNITLPAPFSSAKYRFFGVNGTYAVGLTYTGTLYLQDGTTQAAGTFAQINLAANGNSIEVWSDGTDWFMQQIGGQPIIKNAVANNQPVALGQFPASLAANGYQKLPNGLIIQWGVSAAVTNTNVSVTFPISFPNACLQCLGAPAYTSSGVAGTATTVSFTSSGATFLASYITTSSNTSVIYFSIGY